MKPFQIIPILLWATTFGQLADPAKQGQTFHAHGVVQLFTGKPVAGADVKFVAAGNSTTVTTDEKGIYDADLPLGLYTMTVLKVVNRNLVYSYQRPLFRVAGPSLVTLDVSFAAMMSCDLVFDSRQPPPTEEVTRGACEGTDRYPVPSKENVPYELSIQYGTRRPADKGYEYRSLRLGQQPAIRVFVAYNLFTLLADDVSYDVESHALIATGKVVVEKTDGGIQLADSMTFKIEDGKATMFQEFRRTTSGPPILENLSQQ